MSGKCMDVKERIYKYSVPEPNSGCWLWTSAERGNRLKYGSMSIGNNAKFAHRASYEAFVGEIPKNKFVLHKCDTPLCVNPDHLFLGTLKDNMSDCKNKNRNPRYLRRTHCKKGHPLSENNILISKYKGVSTPYCKTCSRARDRKRRMAL
jgi:hypothetical protein